MAMIQAQIGESQDGRKLLQCVREILPELDDAAIRRIVQHRDIKLDGKRVSSNVSVHSGQIIQIYYLDKELKLPEIVYMDPDVILVNKRAGISVESNPEDHSASLCDLLSRTICANEQAPIPCHRLDNQTSGLLLFARNQHAADVLQRVFMNRTLDKRYTCIVRGGMKPPEATCKAYLLKDSEAGRVRIIDHETAGARTILTAYKTLEAHDGLSLLSVHLITGRTHQIRAHLAALGHPILGDDVYGDRQLNRTRHVQGKLMLCATLLCLDTGGELPLLDGKVFSIQPPFQSIWSKISQENPS